MIMDIAANIENVIKIMRETATSEIMPRFMSLAKSDIVEKKPGDLVTIADIEAEKHLESSLKRLLVGSIAVGEEATAKNPELLETIATDVPVWLIDPIDGTFNFANDKPCFAIIIACCVGGETIGGWIHDPINDTTIWAIKGGGAWMGKGTGTGNQRLQVAKTKTPEQMKGSLSQRMHQRINQHCQNADSPQIIRYHCVGREYMDLSQGILDFALYARRLMPWDHAAGVLIHNEAGGYSALTSNGEAYLAAKGGHYVNDSLLLASDKNSWNELGKLLKLAN